MREGHRLRPLDRRVRPLLISAVPVIGAAGVAAAVVLGGGALATSTVGPPAPVAPVQVGSAGGAVPSWLREAAAAPGPLAGIIGDAATAAQQRREHRIQEQLERQEQQQREEQQQARSAGGVCDLEGPPRFDDPEHPNEITNRDCGYVDDQGRERSRDPWIDGQMLSSYGE